MAQQRVISSFSNLREDHSNGKLQLGVSVTLEYLTITEIDCGVGSIVLRDFRKSKMVCFMGKMGLLDNTGIGYLSFVNVTGTYHPSSSVINDEFFRIYKIERCG